MCYIIVYLLPHDHLVIFFIAGVDGINIACESEPSKLYE